MVVGDMRPFPGPTAQPIYFYSLPLATRNLATSAP